MNVSPRRAGTESIFSSMIFLFLLFLLPSDCANNCVPDYYAPVNGTVGTCVQNVSDGYACTVGCLDGFAPSTTTGWYSSVSYRLCKNGTLRLPGFTVCVQSVATSVVWGGQPITSGLKT